MVEGAESTSGIRVFAGGIGGSVGADDIRMIFGKFGDIARVEIVRTKGRGFAYFDLVPSKPNSLNNLLSTYNGCAWKGGKLRLEKAREHYLSRLRREWAEDSELIATPVDINDAEKSTAVQERSKKFLDSEKQLCTGDVANVGIGETYPVMYEWFNAAHVQNMEQRLKNKSRNKKKPVGMIILDRSEVKSLPYRGTGKHKYSFQRVDVPLMPAHFCDCDEHADLTQSLKMEQPHKLEMLDGGIEAEELDLMKSVINKLFQVEKCLESTQNGVVLPEQDISMEEYVTLGIEDSNGSMVDDDDDLVINIMSDAGNTKSISHTGEVLARKTPDSIARDAPKDKPVPKLMVRQNGSSTSSKKKRKSLISAEGLFKESSTANSGELAGHSNASVVDDDDDDDLVINVVPGAGNTDAITQMSGFFAHEKPDSYTKDALKNQTYKKRQKFLNSAETLHKESSVATEDELTICSYASGENLISVPTGSNSVSSLPKAQPLSSRKSSWKALIGSEDDKSFSISNIRSSLVLGNDQHPGPDDSKVSSAIAAEIPPVVPSAGIKDKAIEPQTLSDARMDTLKSYPSSIKSARGSSWLHDSSWTQLVNSRDTSFSISHLLPVSRCERSELAVGTAADKPGFIQPSNGPVEEGSDRLPSGEEGLQKSVRSSGVVFQEEDKKPGDGNNTASREMSLQSNAKMTPFVVTEQRQHPTTRVSMIGPDEPCPFMRSEASLRDWANTKAALMRSHKRKK